MNNCIRIFSTTALTAGLLCCTATLGTGCATASHTTGRPIAQTKVEQIVEGQTTVAQVISMFGRPDMQTQMGDKTLYTYKQRTTSPEACRPQQYMHGD